MAAVLSEQISALRKERGLTQEQLGQLLGVSAQAVSKWEKGGAPDVELLPSLADVLGVTIGALFGRNEQKLEDFITIFRRWLNTENDQRLLRLFHLLGSSFPSLSPELEKITNGVPDCFFNNSAYIQTPGKDPTLFRSKMVLEEGLALSILSDELPFFLLLPEPPAGYEAHFLDNDSYQRLFSALAMEGSLEILRYLYAHKSSYYTAAAIAKRVGLAIETVTPALAAMKECHLLQSKTLELEDDAVDVYIVHDENKGLVPMLYIARWFMEKDDAWSCSWELRERPILSLTDKQKEHQHEEKK